MSTRINLVVDEEEKARFRRQAEREGLSLSEWLREAARAKADDAEDGPPLDTVEGLREFFAACDRREEGREPDWEEHRRVIEESVGTEGTGA